MSAYEITYESDNGPDRITFLDTPGHEAFIAMRERGATVADIAILVVAADDGVEAQTKETIQAIRDRDIPFIVAINKVDKSSADPDAVIQELAEHEVYVEGFGGDVPYEEISAKTGEGVDELLELVTLNAELLELTTNPDDLASGVVIESSVNPQRGVETTLVVKNGTLKQGNFIHADGCTGPIRILEDFRGDTIKEAQASAPVQVVGFNDEPAIGSNFETFESKEEAETFAKDNKRTDCRSTQSQNTDHDGFSIPILVKADVAGTIDAVIHELQKLNNEKVTLNIVHTGVGQITEDDIRKVADNSQSALAVGFNVTASQAAQSVAKRRNVAVKTAPIIYELIEWLKPAVEKRTPTITKKVVRGKARILKNFSSKRDMQVVGGEVVSGKIIDSAGIIIYRNETEIAEGEIVELQQQRAETEKVQKGQEFGANIRSDIDIAPGDIIESFEMVEK
jgi:translation initiation factor IF-2